MNIIHLVEGRCSGESANGVDRSMVHFARQQTRLGHEVKMIGVSRKSPYQIDGIESVTTAPGPFRFWPSRETREEILRGSPDILHLHGAYVPIYPGIARFARKVGLPYVFTPHGNYSPLLLRRQPLVKNIYRFLFELPMAQRALFVHAIADRDDIRSYGVTAPIVPAINGIDLPDLTGLGERKKVLGDLGVPEGAMVFLFLGRLDIPQKGLDVLVRGFAEFLQVLEPESKAHLVLTGPSWDGSQRKLIKLASKAGILSRISLTGGIYGEQKKALIRHCDFFVHPSRWEAGVPFSVLDALAHGKQCLVTASIDRDKTLRRAGVVETCELTPRDLAEALVTLSRQAPEERARRATEARELVGREFSWEKSARILTDGYQSFLEKRRS